MPCFNQRYFDIPLRRVAVAWARTGLKDPLQERKDISGNIYWRMGSSSEPWERNATSAWWVSQATFEYIVGLSKNIAGDDHRVDRTFRRLARMKLAVLPSWGGRHDLVVRAALRCQARIFYSKGRFVSDEKDNVQYQALGAFEIEQIFLPGLSWPDENDLARKGLDNIAEVKKKAISGWEKYADVVQFPAYSYFKT